MLPSHPYFADMFKQTCQIVNGQNNVMDDQCYDSSTILYAQTG